MSKLVWRVDPKPTGPYRSFQPRNWPAAHWHGSEQPAVRLVCEDAYHPSIARTAAHAELRIRVAVPTTDGKFEWRQLRRRAKTLNEAKAIAAEYFIHNKEYTR